MVGALLDRLCWTRPSTAVDVVRPADLVETPIRSKKTSETMIAKNPNTIPAIATPPLAASPRLTRPCPTNPMMTAQRPRMTPPITDQQNISPMIASTSAAMPSPLRGPVGGGAKPGYGGPNPDTAAVGAAGSWSCRWGYPLA